LLKSLKSESRILNLIFKNINDKIISVGIISRGPTSFDGVIIALSKAEYELFKEILESKFYDEIRLLVVKGHTIDPKALYTVVGKPVMVLNDNYNLEEHYGIEEHTAYIVYKQYIRLGGALILRFLNLLLSEVEKIINTFTYSISS